MTFAKGGYVTQKDSRVHFNCRCTYLTGAKPFIGTIITMIAGQTLSKGELVSMARKGDEVFGIAQHNAKKGECINVRISSCSIIGVNNFNDSRLTLKQFIRRYIMVIDLHSKTIDFQYASIDDLILADIQLSNIVAKIADYDYDMEWLTEKHEEIKSELKIKLAKKNRARLKELQKERKEHLTGEDKLKAIDDEIEKIKMKMK